MQEFRGPFRCMETEKEASRITDLAWVSCHQRYENSPKVYQVTTNGGLCLPLFLSSRRRFWPVLLFCIMDYSISFMYSYLIMCLSKHAQPHLTTTLLNFKFRIIFPTSWRASNSVQTLVALDLITNSHYIIMEFIWCKIIDLPGKTNIFVSNTQKYTFFYFLMFNKSLENTSK